MDVNIQAPVVWEKPPQMANGTHERYTTEEVVRRLRESADFIEAGHGGVQRFTRMRQEVSHGHPTRLQVTNGQHDCLSVCGRVSRWVLNVTYIDKRRDR